MRLKFSDKAFLMQEIHALFCNLAVPVPCTENNLTILPRALIKN